MINCFLYRYRLVHSMLIIEINVFNIKTLQASFTAWPHIFGRTLDLNITIRFSFRNTKFRGYLDLFSGYLLQSLVKQNQNKRWQTQQQLTTNKVKFSNVVIKEIYVLNENVWLLNRNRDRRKDLYLPNQKFIGMRFINISCIKKGDSLTEGIHDYRNAIFFRERVIVGST